VFLDSVVKLNECDFVKLNVKLDVKLNIKVRQEYYGMKCNDKYYIFNVIEWEENGYYKKIMYLVDFKEEELYKIDEIYEEIQENPSKFFDNLFNNFNNRYKYKTNYNFLFLSLLKKNKPNYEYIIIINIKNNEIYIPLSLIHI